MSRMLRGPVLFLFVLLISALPILAQVSQASNSNGSTAMQAPQQQQQAGATSAQLPVVAVQPRFHGTPWRDPNAITGGPVGNAAPAGAHLSYFGGPVISNTHVVQ